jgi:hypothetical protein
LTPKTLLTPAALRFLGAQIIVSDQLSRVATGDQLPRGNPLLSYGITLKSEARLDQNSTTAWYLFSTQMWAPLLIAFLNGQQGITVESMNAEADTLGQIYRAYLDVGVSLGEPRAAVKSRP